LAGACLFIAAPLSGAAPHASSSPPAAGAKLPCTAEAFEIDGHPDKVRAWVGIDPVCNLGSGPLKNSKQKVPMFVVHGDSDLAAPDEENTRVVKERYEAGGGAITEKLIPGEGPTVVPSFFECQELLDFVLRQR
jgi:hypothetical protein